MLIEKVVVNSSPLIVFFRSGQADLFPQLFKNVVVPEQVYEEVTAKGVTDPASESLPCVSWVDRRQVPISLSVASWSLGYGESAVLSFALNQIGYTAVIDDFAARRCAKILGIRTIGTGGLLVLAKRRGLISSVEDQVSRMRDNGLYLSNAVIKALLSEAGE